MLSIAEAEAAGAQARAYKLSDGGGLYLHVAPTGTKTWRLKYRLRGVEKLLTIGRFPAVSLARAREEREAARYAIAAGRRPGEAAAAAQTLEQLARAWYRHNEASWSGAHAADVIASLERDVFPAIGAIGATEVTATDLLNAMRVVEARGCVETARRVRQRLSAVFGFGIAQEIVTRDPAAQLGRAMAKGRPARPHPALTSIDDCRALLAACDAAPIAPAVALAGRFLALTAVRLDCVRGARWGEIEDLDGPEPVWRVPAARMKLARAKKGDARFDHLVPLSPQAVRVLQAARELVVDPRSIRGEPHENGYDTHTNGLVFPGSRPNSPFGENALRDLYARAGFAGAHVPHGWRASFSTIMNEDRPDWRADIDRALAHSPKDKVEAAYNRSVQLARRRAVFDRWGELLGG